MFDYRNFIKMPYYYVPPCPACGSEMTGRFVKSLYNTDYTFRESLRNGELVKVISYDTEDNAFCCNCSFTWPQVIEVSYLTIAEINQQKNLRGTNDILQNEIDELNQIKKEKKQKKGLLSNITSFIGRI